MNTITIDTHHMPITEKLEQTFLEYYAYYSLPIKVKCRIDPQCKQSQWLWDDFRSALYDAWVEYLEHSGVTDDEFDLLEELIHDQDESEVLDQLELVLELETAE
jgi:beta-xylosidase